MCKCGAADDAEASGLFQTVSNMLPADPQPHTWLHFSLVTTDTDIRYLYQPNGESVKREHID